jgi:hypothetical protein
LQLWCLGGRAKRRERRASVGQQPGVDREKRRREERERGGRTKKRQMASAAGGAAATATLFDYVVVVAVQDGAFPSPSFFLLLPLPRALKREEESPIWSVDSIFFLLFCGN